MRRRHLPMWVWLLACGWTQGCGGRTTTDLEFAPVRMSALRVHGAGAADVNGDYRRGGLERGAWAWVRRVDSRVHVEIVRTSTSWLVRDDLHEEIVLPVHGTWTITAVIVAPPNEVQAPRRVPLYLATSEWTVPPRTGWTPVKARGPGPTVEPAASSNATLLACDALLGPKMGQVRRRPDDDLAFRDCVDRSFAGRVRGLDPATPAVNEWWQRPTPPAGPATAQVHVDVDGNGKSTDPAPVFSTVHCESAALYRHRPPVRWCKCDHCGYRDGRVLIFRDPSLAGSDLRPAELTIPLGYPYSHEYFQPHRGDGEDVVFGTVVHAPFPAPDECARAVHEQAVVVAAPWVRHIWHLLFDVLQPLFNTVLRGGPGPAGSGDGSYSQDARVWVHRQERDGDRLPEEAAINNSGAGSLPLAEEIELAVRHDRPTRLWRLFTRWPVQDKRQLDDGGLTCFDSVHLGLDPRGTPFAFGVQHPAPDAMVHPDALVGPEPPLEIASGEHAGVLRMRREHLQFKRFLASGLTNVERWQEHETITVVRRSGVRSLTNHDALLAVARESGQPVVDARLEKLPFSQQVELFANTSILVAVHGQALANTLFLRDGAVVVLLTEPGQFGVKWMFGNLALASNVHVVLVRRPEDGCLDHAGWGGVKDHLTFNKIVPNGTALDPGLFRKAIDAAVAVRRDEKSSARTTSTRTTVTVVPSTKSAECA